MFAGHEFHFLFQWRACNGGVNVCLCSWPKLRLGTSDCWWVGGVWVVLYYGIIYVQGGCLLKSKQWVILPPMEINYGLAQRPHAQRPLTLEFFLFRVVIFLRGEIPLAALWQVGPGGYSPASHCKALLLSFFCRGQPIYFVTWPGCVLMNILIIPLNGSAYWAVFATSFLQINMEEGGVEKRRRWENRRTLMNGLLCMFSLVEITFEPIFPRAVIMVRLWAVNNASWLDDAPWCAFVQLWK